MHDPVRTVHRRVWRESGVSEGLRTIPEETALALTYNGGTYAVMMGTPQNLRDFAVGFSLSEGIVQSADDIRSLDIVHLDDGIELRMWLEPSHAERLNERRRHIAGPTGCGICGIDSIAEAVRPAAIVAEGRSFSPQQIMTAMQSHRAAADDQYRNPRGARRGVLDAGPRHRRACARTSAATTRSTSWPARWHRARLPQARAWCC